MSNDVIKGADAIEIADRLRPVLLTMGRELRREVAPLGVTGGQASLLAAIHREPGIGVRELADLERMSAPGMSANLSRLERMGYVIRTRGAGGDRRRVGLTLSPEGVKMLRRDPLAAHALARGAARGPLARRARRRRRRDRAARPPAAGEAVTQALVRLNRRTFASLQQYPNYRLFFGGQVISVTGSWMQNIASGWLIVTLTHSPVAVGVLALAQFLPFTIFGLFAGVVVDRFDNRKLIIGTQAVQMVLAAALATIALGGVAVPWMVYVIAFMRGTVLVLDVPARQSLTYRMVGPAELPNAIALNSSLFNASRVIGPALGGLVIAAIGLGFCFVANAVSFLAVLASLLLMDERKLFPVRRPDVMPTIWRGTREGLGFVLGNRRVRVTLLIVLVISTLSFNLNVILPVLASTTLHAGPQTFGIISACFGAGALIGALVSASVGRASWKILAAGTGLFGLAELLLAPERSVWAAGVLLIVLGAAFTTWTSNANSGVQLEAPDHLRGRVVGLYFYAFNGAAPLGGLLVGWLSAMGGTELALAVGGIAALTMTVVGVVALRDEPARPKPLAERAEPTALAA